MNVTAGSGGGNNPDRAVLLGSGATMASAEVSSLSGRVQEALGASNTVSWAVLVDVAARNESVLCNVTEAMGHHDFSFFQNSRPVAKWDKYVLLDNQLTCHVLRTNLCL